MKNFLTILQLSILLSFITACNNDDSEPEVATKSNEEFLVDNKWQLNSVQTVPPIEGINPMDYLEACEVDNQFDFVQGGVLLVDEGATKCNEDGPQSITGSWTLSNNGQVIQLTYAGREQNFNIQEISDERLVVQSTIDFQGISFTGNLTFVSVE